MNKTEQNEEQVIQEALQLLEEGKPITTVVDTYPAFTAQLYTLAVSIEHIKQAKNIKPSPELLRNSLKKIASPLPSPLHWSTPTLWKMSVSVFAIAVLVVGGTTIISHNSTFSTGRSGSQTIVMNNTADTSDVALNQDVAAIDNQLGGLKMDETQADQSLGKGI